jgi:hypothetical protein
MLQQLIHMLSKVHTQLEEVVLQETRPVVKLLEGHRSFLHHPEKKRRKIDIEGNPLHKGDYRMPQQLIHRL